MTGGRLRAVKRLSSPFAQSSDSYAIGIVSLDVAMYFVSLSVFCLNDSWIRWLALAVASLTAGLLFIVGHDACHLALARTARVNKVIALLAFVPTLHPPSAWIVGHNRRHHGSTNLRGVDYVWCPWSPEDFQGATELSRRIYTLYHSPVGIGLYYFVEIWLKHMWGGDHLDKQLREKSTRIARDRASVIIGVLGIFAYCVTLGSIAHHDLRPEVHAADNC
jgi:omega-6 fatty acid desaturase (delta-12 desaturase)